MRCQRCNGTGRLSAHRVQNLQQREQRVGKRSRFSLTMVEAEFSVEPCPECNGTGIAHCCDGICAQAEDGEACDGID